MSVTTHVPANDGKKPGAARRQAAARMPETARSRQFRLPVFVPALLALILGMGIGALTVRHYSHADSAIAAVNGTVLTKNDFFHRLERATGPAVLQQMINEDMQLQYAQKLGLAPTEAEIHAAYERMRQQPHFAQQMATSRQSPEDIRHRIAVDLAGVALLGRGQKVTEADMRAYYRAQTDKRNPRALYYHPATATIAVIITPSEVDSRKALSALAEGAPFAKVAAVVSKDQSKKNGGMRPPSTQGRTGLSHIPGLVEAIFGMKVHGQLSPRRFAGFWWIIRCLDKTPETIQPYEQVREYCRRGALVAKGFSAHARQTQQDFTAFCKGSQVQVFWPQYSRMAQGR